MKYLVKNTYKYTAEVWVEADCEKTALDMTCDILEGEERNEDDTWYDSEVIDKKE